MNLGTSTPDTTHPTAAQEDVGLLGRGMQFLGLKKKPQTDEEEIPSWHTAQDPMTEQESQSFRRRRASERAGEDTSTYSGQEELPEAEQSVFQTRLSNMGPEAQDEMKAMRAQEEEAKHNPPVALGPSPIPLTDLAPGARLPADEQPLQFFIKRKGYNDILILGGGTKHGECVYYGDVAAKVMGWDITLRRGSSREGQPLIHIGKALRWWDKNTKVYLSDATPGKEYTPDQVAEADQTANFEYMTPEEQERMKLRQGTDADDPELAASRQQASMAMMGLSSPPADSSAPEHPQMPSQPGASSAAPTGSEPSTMSKHDSFSSQPGYSKVQGPLTAALAGKPESTPSEQELRAAPGSNISRAAWLPGMGTTPAMAGEHPWNAATGTVNKVGVGIKATGQYIKGNFIKKDLVKERAGAEPMAVLRHLHEFSGNQNVLSYNGRQYVWNWMRFLGGKHTLMDVETKEVVAVGALQFTFAWQWITAWGFRLTGPLTITGKGKDFADIIVASYLANLEWRKHNNKIWQIIIWTAA